MKVIIPIVESTEYFPESEYFFSKPLVEVDEKPMILRVAENYERQIDIEEFIFIAPKEIVAKYSLEKLISINLESSTRVIIKEGETNGGLCSALLAIDYLEENSEVIVANMDELIENEMGKLVYNYRRVSADIGIGIYKSNHPRWCYAQIDREMNVRELAEKKVISKDAVAGMYYFRSKDILVENAKKAIMNGDKVNGSFYMSAAINQAILNNQKVIAHRLKKGNYHSLYSPEGIKKYELTNQKRQEEYTNLLIPAAGKGSRFAKDGWRKPKPFIKIDNKTMLENVLENIDLVNSRRYIVIQKEFGNEYQEELRRLRTICSKIIEIDGQTKGTASTIVKAREYIDNDNGLLIANSDQIVDFDCNKMIEDAKCRGLDGSILVFREKEGNNKWSYAKLGINKMVIEVAEKRAISELATVGIYYFRKGSYFIDSYISMVEAQDMTNEEYYTCPLYNYMIKRGLNIGIYEIKEEEMNGIGTPNDLRKYLIKTKRPKSVDDPIQ